MEPLILTDEEIIEAFGNSNFGPGVTTPEQRRQFIARTLFQYSCGYQSGSPFSLFAVILVSPVSPRNESPTSRSRDENS